MHELLKPIFCRNVGQPLGQCRAAPVCLGAGSPPAFLIAYSGDFDVDPYPEMFFFPTDTLKLALWTCDGEELWRKDLGPAVVPGLWFTPILPCDLDGDGRDEIYLVGNSDPQHPLSHRHRQLWRLDAQNGELTGEWPWPPHLQSEPTSSAYRNFLIAGRANGRTVLVTAQGTYGAMHLQGRASDLSALWKRSIALDAPGARGSHMTAVVDWDGDGNDEFFWGERLIRFDDGREMFCADKHSYDGHSDVVSPFFDESTSKWFVFTCRETERTFQNFPSRAAESRPIRPRIVTFGSEGLPVWSALDEGHIDIGFVAHPGPDHPPLAAAVRIDTKSCGPDGRHHTGIEPLFFHALTGEPLHLPWSPYRALPVDLDGDGWHEFVSGAPGGDGSCFRVDASPLGQLGGPTALCTKLTRHAGEQVLTYDEDGSIRLWATTQGEDSPRARSRFGSPFYQMNSRLSASGYNRVNTGGI